MANPQAIPPPNAGVRKDVDPEDVPDGQLIDSENMIQRDGNFQWRPGFIPLAASVNERPMSYFEYADFLGDIRIVMATNRGWRVLGSNVWNDITDPAHPLTVTDPEQTTVFRTFSKAGVSWLLGTNGVDSVKKWDGVTLTYADVGGNPPLANCMMSIADRIVLGHLNSGDTISPVAIDISNNKDFDAGYGTQLVALLGETAGHIVSMLEMGTLQGAIIKSDSLYLLIAQAGVSDPFRLQWIKSGLSGPPSSPLSFKLADGRIGWAGVDGSVSLFDGASVSQLPYHIQKQITSTFNPDKFGRGWARYDSERRELWIIYPLLGSSEPNGGIIINMTTLEVYPLRWNTIRPTAGIKGRTEGGITIGDLTMSIGQIYQTLGELGESSVIRRFILGNIDGQSLQDTGTTDNGSPIPFFWENPVRGQAEKFTTITRIRHRFYPTQGPQLVNFQLGKRNEAGEITYGPIKTIDLASTKRKVTGHRTSAEYFNWRYSGNATELTAYNGGAAYGIPRGKR